MNPVTERAVRSGPARTAYASPPTVEEPAEDEWVVDIATGRVVRRSDLKARTEGTREAVPA